MTREQLVHELTELRSQNAVLKKSIAESLPTELVAEEARRYAESIVETVREPLLVLNADLEIISANHSFYRTFKVTPGETIGTFIYDLGNKQWDIPELRNLLEEVLPKQKAFDDFEVDHNFQDIGHKIMLLNARQIYRKDIGAKMILLAIEDITERREIEIRLEKTRKELEIIKRYADEALEYAESIINTVREPLIALDHDLRVVTASRSFYKVFKVESEETVGQLIYDLGNKQWDIVKLRELLETILPQETTFDNYEVEHDFTTIGRRTMLLNARQIQRVLGKERIILLAMEDITEHKRLENLLTESEARFRRLFETAQDGIVLLEKREGKIAHTNPAAQKMFGYTKEECIGTKLPDIGVLLDRGDFQTTMQILNRNGIINYNDVPVKTKSGQHIDTDIYLVDRAELVQCNIRDITERKQEKENVHVITRRLHLATSSAKAGVWDWNLQTNEMIWDDRMLQLYGLTQENFPGGIEAWEQGLHPDDSLRAIEECQAALRGERDFDTEFRVLHPDGTVVHIKANGIVLRDEKGKPLRMIGLNTDISDRKRSEEALREKEKYYRSLVEGMPVIVYTFSKKRGGVYYSSNVTSLLGYSPEQLYAQPQLWHNAIHPDDLSYIEQIIRESATGKPFCVEYRIRDAHGNWRWFEDRSFGFKVDGEDAIIDGLAFDITERKQAEEALRESRQGLEFALQSGGLGVWDWYPHTGTVAYSDLWAHMLEYRPDEVEPTVDFFKRHIHPEDLPAVLDRLTGHIEGRMPVYESEHRMRAKSGRWLWVTDRGKVVEWDKDGRPVRATGIITDITDRKRMEARLHQSEEKFSKAFQTSPYAITITRPEDGTFIEVNEAFTSMTGFTRDEGLAGSSIGLKMWVNEEDRQSVVAALSNGQAIVGKEYPFRTKSGKVITGLFSAQSIHLNIGHCILSSINDITERKQAEEEKIKLEAQLFQSQKMESVGRLAGGVAHDFNNMLGVILGYVEIAIEHLDPAQPLHADLQEIRKAAARSADLTRQLLAFARKQVVSPKVLDLNDTMAGMLNMLQRLIGENINLAWLPGANLWPVKIDPSQIDQILANLCVNARDAITGVGKITIETRNITLDEVYCADHAGFVPGEYVLLTMSDNGCGMDKEILGKLFEPFFTTKGVGKGTGLGLATIYGIVKQNNGFINVYSEPDHGTTFRIYLPRHIGKAEQAQTEVRQEQVIRGHETVLVVEDEPSLLELSKLMLETQGYRVLTAGTPGEAMRLAEKHAGEIHLLMTDVVLPEMNGPDLAQKLLSVYPNLKCLFTSGYTADVITHHGVLDEGVYFIQKPFSRKDLAAKVREVLDHK